MIIYTIGHSTRSLEDFVAWLQAYGVTQLADIRTIPKSRRHPHFCTEALAASLPIAGIAYRHMRALGGLRKPRTDSRNSAWRHPSFRGYADYMETAAFAQGLEELMEWAAGATTVIMCAEAVWWRCHRQLVADALLARSVDVQHIMSRTEAPAHRLTEFSRVGADLRVTYPGLIQ